MRYREFFHISMCYIAAIDEYISRNLHHHAREQMVNSHKSNDLEMSRSNTMKTTVWAITLELEVVEISGWLQNVPIGRVVSELTYEVPFLRQVTSNIFFLQFCFQSIKVILDQYHGQISRFKVKKKVKVKCHVTYFLLL